MRAIGNSQPRGRGRGRGPAQGNLPARLPSGKIPRVLPQRGVTLPIAVQGLKPGAQGNTPPATGGTPAPAGTATPTMPAKTPGRGRTQGQGAQGNGGGKGKIGLGGAAMAGPGGRQLAARVSSGKITQEQADRTMQQRQTLAKAFGKDWRSHISSGGQSFAKVNQGLAKSPQDPKLAALRKRLVEGRQKALMAAKQKGEAPPPKKRKKGKGGADAHPGESDE